MTYMIVIVLSVIATFLGFAFEITIANIVHVQNHREPNAGAAIFPNIPFVPLFVVGVVWLLDRIYPVNEIKKMRYTLVPRYLFRPFRTSQGQMNISIHLTKEFS